MRGLYNTNAIGSAGGARAVDTADRMRKITALDEQLQALDARVAVLAAHNDDLFAVADRLCALAAQLIIVLAKTEVSA